MAIEQREIREVARGYKGRGEFESIRCGGRLDADQFGGRPDSTQETDSGLIAHCDPRTRSYGGKVSGSGQEFCDLPMFIGNAQKDLMAMGVKGCRRDCGDAGQNLQPGDSHERNGGAFGQALGCAEPDTYARKASGAVDYDNAANLRERNSLPCEQFLDGCHERGGVGAALKVFLGDSLLDGRP